MKYLARMREKMNKDTFVPYHTVHVFKKNFIFIAVSVYEVNKY